MVRTVFSVPGDGGEGRRNGDYADERPEGETGLGKIQVVLVRKKMQTNQMEMKLAGVKRKR